MIDQTTTTCRSYHSHVDTPFNFIQSNNDELMSTIITEDFVKKNFGLVIFEFLYQNTLFSHLANTASLLESWGSTKEVCLSGLFHSVYGPELFHKHAVPVPHEIRKIIGIESGFLIFCFSVMRRRSLFTNPQSNEKYSIIDRFQRKQIFLSRKIYTNLLTIALPNWLEALPRRVTKPVERYQDFAHLDRFLPEEAVKSLHKVRADDNF